MNRKNRKRPSEKQVTWLISNGGRLFVKFYSPKSPEKISWKFHEMRFLFFLANFTFCFEFPSGVFEFRGLFGNRPENAGGSPSKYHRWIQRRRLRWFYIFYHRNKNGGFMPEFLRRYFTFFSFLERTRALIARYWVRFRDWVSQIRLIRTISGAGPDWAPDSILNL